MSDKGAIPKQMSTQKVYFQADRRAHTTHTYERLNDAKNCHLQQRSSGRASELSMCTCNQRSPLYRRQPSCRYNNSSRNIAVEARCPVDACGIPPTPPVTNKDYRTSMANGYCTYELGSKLTDEEDSAFPALQDREFHILHNNIPALRRSGVDTIGIRQHFYPDGGWGWIICSASFLVSILTTGLQFSYGLFFYFAFQHLQNITEIDWLGALNLCISSLATPFIVLICRKKSTRLVAVVGGLVLPLGILFTSFAKEYGQALFSYGIVFGLGVAMVRESSGIMLGNYFKRRRKYVEKVAMSGEGLGVVLFAAVFKEGLGNGGWRSGLQIVAALLSVSFFLGLLYRPASLYHPQRRAILHLKNQRKKVHEKKTSASAKKKTATWLQFFDTSCLRTSSAKILLLVSSISALGINTPIFTMSIDTAREGADIQELIPLQAFLGSSMAFGVFIAGDIIRRPIKVMNYTVTCKILSQISIGMVTLAILFLSFLTDYKSTCVLSWLYGLGFGGFKYSFKMLALEQLKIKNFTKAWGFIKGAECIPVLIGLPLTSFLNDYSLKYGRAGNYICSAATAIAGITIFFISPSETVTTGRSADSSNRMPEMRASNQRFSTELCDLPQLCCVPNRCDLTCTCFSEEQLCSCYRKSPYHICRYAGGLQTVPRVACFCNTAERNAYQRAPLVNAFQTENSNSRRNSCQRLGRSQSFVQRGVTNLYNESKQCYTCAALKDNLMHRQRQQLAFMRHSGNQLGGQDNCRSRSVPEGLSFISENCNCHGKQQATLKKYASAVFDSNCKICRQHTASAAAAPFPLRQRSRSLSRSCRYLDQMTTTV